MVLLNWIQIFKIQLTILPGDDVPFIVILVHTNPNDKKKKKRTLSKGVLISEKFVLTTVSSIYHGHAFWAVTSVRLGDFVTWNKYANRDKSNVVEMGIEQVFYHTNKDIALIKLKGEVQFTGELMSNEVHSVQWNNCFCINF